MELLSNVEDLGRHLFLELLAQLLHLKPHLSDIVFGLGNIAVFRPTVPSRRARSRSSAVSLVIGTRFLGEEIAHADQFLVNELELPLCGSALPTEPLDLCAVLFNTARQNANLPIEGTLPVTELQGLVEENTGNAGIVLAPQEVLRKLDFGNLTPLGS